MAHVNIVSIYGIEIPLISVGAKETVNHLSLSADA